MAFIHPSNLKATVVNTTVKLTWSIPYYGPCTFNVRRGTTTGQETTVLAVGLASASYTDTKPLTGTNFYLVDAIYPAEPCTNEVSVSIGAPVHGIRTVPDSIHVSDSVSRHTNLSHGATDSIRVNDSIKSGVK